MNDDEIYFKYKECWACHYDSSKENCICQPVKREKNFIDKLLLKIKTKYNTWTAKPGVQLDLNL